MTTIKLTKKESTQASQSRSLQSPVQAGIAAAEEKRGGGHHDGGGGDEQEQDEGGHHLRLLISPPWPGSY